NAAYPGRCVIDMGASLALLRMGESIKLENLPCTMIFCMGEGYGLLRTCDHKPPPDDCQYADYIYWNEEYPKCCKRRISC
ncbi:CG34178, partial [Drosophila busckii]